MISVQDLRLATGGQFFGEPVRQEFIGLSDDSSSLSAGQLLVVRPTQDLGQAEDIERALAAGAGGLLCETPPVRDTGNLTTLLVGDTRLALEQWASYILRKYHPVTIGVVGGIGKTSVCAAIAAALSNKYAVYVRAMAHRGPFGLALDVSDLSPEHQYAVFEIDGDEYMSVSDWISIVQPQLLVVTTSLAAGAFGEKWMAALPDSVLADAISRLPAKSSIVCRADDRARPGMRDVGSRQVLTHSSSLRGQGATAQADMSAENVQAGTESLQIDLRMGRELVKDIRLPGIGVPALECALGALAACRVIGLPISDALAGLADSEPLGGLRLTNGRNGSVLIDSASDAQPETILAVMDWLNQGDFQTRRKSLFLTGFAMAGDALVEACHEIGRRAATTFDALAACDQTAIPSVYSARRCGLAWEKTFLPHQRQEAVALLNVQLGAGDALVVVLGKPAGLSGSIRTALGLPDVRAASSPLQLPAPARVQTAVDERTWLEIDLTALTSNVRLVKAGLESHIRLMADVKDDGYRHGVLEVASVAVRNGADILAVAAVQEGLVLRDAGIGCPILVMGHVSPSGLRQSLTADLTVTIHSESAAQLLIHQAHQMRRSAKCHIRVAASGDDAGVPIGGVVALVRDLARSDSIAVDGLYVEISPAIASGSAQASPQFHQFEAIIKNLAAVGIDIPNIYTGGSATVQALPKSPYSVVRIGHLMYGLAPHATMKLPEGLQPTLAWRTAVTDIVVDRASDSPDSPEHRFAVIPVGYRQGLARDGHPGASALIEGARMPLSRKIGPDWAYVDISALRGGYIGDEVTLIGRQGNERITVEEIALRRGCTIYDVISALPKRLARGYISDVID